MEFKTFVEQLKSKVNIVDIVSRYVTLARKGNKHWGCCPFHHEKTPSFSVDEYNQFYYCFGCKATGDVLKFIENAESTDFLGAVKFLCDFTGTTMPTFSGQNSDEVEKQKRQRDRLSLLLKESARYYHENLKKSENSEAYKYLIKRGISAETIRRFGLGLSLDWKGICIEMKKRGYTSEELFLSGVCGKREDNTLYDAYGTRIMFPIVDSFNQVVAFGGRTLDKTKNAKYKNTSDTPVFNKKRVLYGLNLVKKEKLKGEVKNVIVVEGYMDAISLYEAGFHNVVASMGTAFTKEHAKLLRYVTDEVLMCFDGDSAGIKGTVLALDILQAEGVFARVICMPQGVDPDDLIKKEGAEAFQRAIDGALLPVEFKLKLIRDKFDFNSAGGRAKFLQGYYRAIASLPTEGEKEIYLEKMSKETGISINSLKKDLAATKSGESPSTLGISTTKEDKTALSNSMRAMRFLLYCVLGGKKDISEIAELERFVENETHKKIFNHLLYKGGRGADIFGLLSDSEQGEFAEIMSANITEKISEENEAVYFQDCLKSFEKIYIDIKLKELKMDYKTEKDNEKRKVIAKEIAELTSKVRA